MANSSKQVVVLGASIEGLAAAATLARAGHRVHLVEAEETHGGASRCIEIHPGHHVPGLLHETSLVRRELLADLDLEQHGLGWKSAAASVHVSSQPGEMFELGRNISSDSKDAAAHDQWRTFVDRLRPLIAEVLDSAPPESREPGMRDMMDLAKKGFKLRRLGESDMMELLRIVTMPAWDWMEECFQDPALRAGMSALVLPGGVVGPRAAGTTALMLMREAGSGMEPIGGLGAVADALYKCCIQLKVDFHFGVCAKQVQIDKLDPPRVRAVQLTDGTIFEADVVMSSLDPQATLLSLVSPGLIPHHVESQVETWRMRGSSAVCLLALKGSNLLPEQAERLLGVKAPEQLEMAADALKYGELPSSPWLDIRDWSRSAPACAPAGHSTLSIHAHGVPLLLKDGWTPERRAELRASIMESLERAVPGIGASIEAEELLTPPDIEERFGLRGGHLYGGEQALDQLWVQRPSLALSRYGTPIGGLYLCGESSHPGGAFAGGAGVLAARSCLGH